MPKRKFEDGARVRIVHVPYEWNLVGRRGTVECYEAGEYAVDVGERFPVWVEARNLERVDEEAAP